MEWKEDSDELVFELATEINFCGFGGIDSVCFRSKQLDRLQGGGGVSVGTLYSGEKVHCGCGLVGWEGVS